jgi:putative membrane protein
VVLIVMTLQRSNVPKPEASPRRTPDDLLADRLARGEIDEDEYRRRRDALRE